MHVESHVPYFHIAHHTSDLDTKIYVGTVLNSPMNARTKLSYKLFCSQNSSKSKGKLDA